MSTQLNVLFMALASRANRNGEAPVYCRLTLNQRQQRFMVGCTVPMSIWDQTKQRATGRSPKAVSVNQHIAAVQQKIHLIEGAMIKQGDPFEVEDVIAQVQGKDQRVCRTLMQLYSYRFKQMEKLKGKDYTQSTLDKFLQLADVVRIYIRATYGMEDIPLSKVNTVFIVNLELYLKTDRAMKQITLNKVIQKLKAVMKMAYEYNWINANPFPGHRFKHDTIDVVYLTVSELQLLETHEFSQERLNRVRYIFLFSVYTGLHYIDAMNLTQNNIITGVDGKQWIKYCRQKTGKWIYIPLLSKAKELMKRFRVELKDSEYLVPRISNQKINSYIKEIGEIVGIETPLTHKVARKTFGSVLLYHNVPMKVVSELMGHSSVLITEKHYAKVELKKLGEVISQVDMKL